MTTSAIVIKQVGHMRPGCRRVPRCCIPYNDVATDVQSDRRAATNLARECENATSAGARKVLRRPHFPQWLSRVFRIKKH
jgi:hypothetical protein